MAKSLHQVQEKIKNLKQQINDILHLTSLNNQSIICLASNKSTLNQPQSPNPTQKQSQTTTQQTHQNNILFKHTQFQSKIKNIVDLLQKRTQNHLNYLIVRQIQGQQESVRRDRLNQYEDKIYDQRRLISDKQVFLQSLYRPKKQRPQSMTTEQFQQQRAKERVQQEKLRLDSLEEQIKKVTVFHQKLEQVKLNQNEKKNEQIVNTPQELIIKTKDQDLQKTKANSLETVNLSAFNNLGQKLQKIVQQTELNTTLNQQNSNKKIQNIKIPQKLSRKDNILQNIAVERHFSMSQKVFDYQRNSTSFSITINKLMNHCGKNFSKQQMKQKLDRIKYLLRRIEHKKEENIKKKKQLQQIQRQNVHMSAHLKKVKENYLNKLNTLNNNSKDIEQTQNIK